MKKIIFSSAFLITALLFFCFPVNAKAVSKPDTVYVADFLLDAKAAAQDSETSSGPIRSMLQKRLASKDDPTARAQELVELLTKSLVEQLKSQGITSSRASTADILPPKGWLIQGEFLELDEGDRLRRAAIGFGSGAAKMQVKVEINDLEDEEGEPFLVFDSSADSGKAPGGAVVAAATKTPYGMAAKFVLGKNASTKDVEHLASQIASSILKYIKENKLM